MAGRFPGRLPLAMRIAAVVQAFVLVALLPVVLGRAGVLPGASTWGRGIWAVVAVMGVSFAMNTLTPSTKERRLWAPVTFAALVSSVIVAVAG